jgi:hypothetical protein
MEPSDLERLAELLAEVRKQCRYVYEFNKCSYAYQALVAAQNAGRMVETILDKQPKG